MRTAMLVQLLATFISRNGRRRRFRSVWGNRNGGHSWNVIIVNGESYAFEAFWDDDRWKYKRIYNNKSYDSFWEVQTAQSLSQDFLQSYGRSIIR